MDPENAMTESLLEAVLNLSHFHREHEKYYAQEPRANAVTLQRHARSLQALADRWSTEPSSQEALNPFEGSQDLNDPTALQFDGVLFMEGQGEPAEIARMKREMQSLADDQAATGSWLADTMAATWDAGKALLEYPELANQLGERHRIVANDWQAAEMSQLAGRLLVRALDVLDKVDFAPVSPARGPSELASGPRMRCARRAARCHRLVGSLGPTVR